MIKKIFICMSILLLGGIAWAEEKRAEIPLGSSPTMGPADAPITIIEFIDFQ